MMAHDTGDFAVSYGRFEHYPTNLLDRSLVRGYPQSLLESLKNRLRVKEDEKLELLFEDVTKCNLKILDLNSDQDGLLIGSTNITPIDSDEDLKVHLGYNSPHQASGSDLPSKVDPNCRFIFLPCENQAEPLQLTANMLRRILSFHQVMPQFLEFLFEFGRKLRITTVRFNGFYSESVAKDPAVAQNVPDGRSGYQYQMCYNMRSAIYEDEPEWKGWSIRQIAVYHNFDIRGAKQIWILGDPEATLAGVITDQYQGSPDTQRNRLGSISDSFRTSLDIHLVYIHQVAINWRTRISDLEADLWEQKSKTLRIRTEDPLGAKHLEALQYAQKNTADVLAVLESNQQNMQALSNFYEHRSNITNNEELSSKEADSCKESTANFIASLREVIHETEMEVRQTKLLLQDFADLQTTTFFSAGVLATKDASNDGNEQTSSDGMAASVLTVTAMRNLWLESALPLTFGTGLIAIVWYYYEKNRINKQGEEKQAKDSNVVQAVKTYLTNALARFQKRKQSTASGTPLMESA
ncbi:hypothetical protein E8E14_010447 [Neopestalotiopsis sp. 37M]|nr:hypothetical protein E8E14_010447 [Neopestalotiopsis sp. 37M]